VWQEVAASKAAPPCDGEAHPNQRGPDTQAKYAVNQSISDPRAASDAA